MKIFCIGLSRTGTTTIHRILEQLGFQGKHYISELLLDNDWSVLDRYDVLGDAPIPLIFKECDERVPHSKFILTTRDKASWLDSMEWMFKHGRVLWEWDEAIEQYHLNLYGTKKYNPKLLSDKFDTYHLEIDNYFKARADDIHRIDITHGVDVMALCQFLNVNYNPNIQVVKANQRRYMSIRDRVKYSVNRMVFPN